MRICKEKLYPKLKGFFHKGYQYSKQSVLEGVKMVSDYDEGRYIASLHYRYDYGVVDGKAQICFNRHLQTESTMCDEVYDVWYCTDTFSGRLIDQLRFVEIDISTFDGFQLVMDYYHNHFNNDIQRKFNT